MQSTSPGASEQTSAAAQTQTGTAEQVQEWLLDKLSAWLALDRDDIDTREPFASYGLSSINAVYLVGELEDWLQIELPPTLAYEYPTVERFAQQVALLAGPQAR